LIAFLRDTQAPDPGLCGTRTAFIRSHATQCSALSGYVLGERDFAGGRATGQRDIPRERAGVLVVCAVGKRECTYPIF